MGSDPNPSKTNTLLSRQALLLAGFSLQYAEKVGLEPTHRFYTITGSFQDYCLTQLGLLFHFEPLVGLEPTTTALQMQYSTC